MIVVAAARTCGRLKMTLSSHATIIIVLTRRGARFLLIGSRIAMHRSMLMMTTMYVDRYSPNTCSHVINNTRPRLDRKRRGERKIREPSIIAFSKFLPNLMKLFVLTINYNKPSSMSIIESLNVNF